MKVLNTRLKHVATVISGQSPASDQVSEHIDGLPFLQGNAEFGALFPSAIWQCEVAPKVVSKGDVLLSVRAPVGAVNLADRSYGIGRGLNSIRATSAHQGYIKWLVIHSSEYLNSVATGSTYLAVTAKDVGSIPVPLVDESKQAAIARFLDREIAQIDALIGKQKELIETLAERRRAVVTRAVTRGLDSNVAMKDSGFGWLGKIPELWELKPFFTVGKELNVKNKGMIENNLLSLSYGNIVLKDIDSNEGLLPESFEGYQIVEPDDLVFRFTDLQNDQRSLRSAVCSQRGIITSAYLAIRLNGVSPKFMGYLMRAFDQIKVFYSMGGGLRQGLSYQDLRRLLIPVPSIEEQVAIASFLDRETTVMDELTQKAASMIELLKERRQALIGAAVTGTMDIRGN